MSIFSPLLTIFILLAGGYFVKRVGISERKRAGTFLDFAIVFVSPCLIFDKAYHLNLDFSLIVLIFTGFFSCALAAFIAVFLGFTSNLSKATLVSMFLPSYFGNTIFMGIPIIEGISANAQFGAEVILYDALAITLPISLLGPSIFSLGSGEKISLIANIKKILPLPPFPALFLGFSCRLIPLLEFIFPPARLLGGAVTPVTLLTIDLGLGFMAIKTTYRPTILVILAEMVLASLILMLLLKLFGSRMRVSIIVAIIESATPTMISAGAMVIKVKLDNNLAVGTAVSGAPFTSVSMPILVWALA